MAEKKYTYWELNDKIEKIIESNCKEYPYEGTEINKGSIKHEIIELIYELAPQYKPNPFYNDNDE